MSDAAAAEARRMQALRLRLVERHPFWGHLLLHVRLVPAPALATLAATDCVEHIWYNPDHTRHLDWGALAFVLLHELGHQVFASHERAQGRDPHLWNCATDYAINRTIAALRDPADPRRPLYPVPRGHVPGLGDVTPLLDVRWQGMVAELIYEHLVAASLPQPRTVTVTLPEGRTLPGVLDHQGGLDVHLPGELPEEKRERLRDRLEDAALAAQSAGEGAGDGPADLSRAAADRRRSRVPWRRLLHRYAAEAFAQVDYSYRRPNRRYLAEGFVVPGLVREEQHDVIVALDTSASMSAELIAQAAAELVGLASATPRVTVIVADARVHEVVAPRDLPAWLAARRFRGGGGTDHRPVFEWLRAARRQPDLFVGLTDLYTHLPAAAPRYPVLWVTPPDHGPAPWGRLVEVG